MKLLKPVFLGLVIAFAMLGCGIFICSIYLSVSLGSFEYGNFLHYSSLGRNADTGAIDFLEYATGEGPWYSYISTWWLSFTCLCISVLGLALYRFGYKLKWLTPILKKLAIGFGVLLIISALFLLEENIRGRIALRSYTRQLRTQGEKLTLAELDLPKSRKEGNGAPALVALTNQFNSLEHECPFTLWFLTKINLIPSGKAVVRWEQSDLGVNRTLTVPESQNGPRIRVTGRSGDYYAAAPVRASWTDLNEQAAKAANTLDAVQQALAQPKLRAEIDYTQGLDIRLPHIQAIQHATRWIALAALNNIRRHDLSAATTNILTIVALLQFQQDERLVISQVTRLQTGSVGLDLTWEALQAPGWTDAQLVALQEGWQKASTAEQVVSAMEMERTFFRDYFEQARHFHQWNQFRIGFLSSTQCGCGGTYSLSTLVSDFQDSIRAVAWRLAWLDQDELRFLQRSQLILDHTRAAVTGKAWSAFGLSDKDLSYPDSYYDRCRFLLSGAFTPNIEYSGLRAFEFETQREMTMAAIAIKRYQLRNGKLPTNLAELTPEYLQQLPHDWMNGKPLGYHPNPDGTFALYSVGTDGRDDGGDPTPIEGKRAYTIWKERDAVWPMPASTAEIDAAASANKLSYSAPFRKADERKLKPAATADTN